MISAEDRYKNRKFQKQLPNMNESTARTFKKKYESELAGAKQKVRVSSASLVLKLQGRQPLGEIDSHMFFEIGVLKIFCNIHRKTPVLESLFNKVAGLTSCPATLLKRDFNKGVFL